METDIKAEEIVLDIHEETVEDAIKRIMEFLRQQGFNDLDKLNNSDWVTYKSHSVIAKEYFAGDKLGLYIFVFKDALMMGSFESSLVTAKSKVHLIIVGVNAKGNPIMCQWGRLTRCLKEKDSLRIILGLKTKEAIAAYINSFPYKRK